MLRFGKSANSTLECLKKRQKEQPIFLQLLDKNLLFF